MQELKSDLMYQLFNLLVVIAWIVVNVAFDSSANVQWQQQQCALNDYYLCVSDTMVVWMKLACVSFVCLPTSCACYIALEIERKRIAFVHAGILVSVRSKEFTIFTTVLDFLSDIYNTVLFHWLNRDVCSVLHVGL